MYIDNIALKAQLLSAGLRITQAALAGLPEDCLSKRRAYGNPDMTSILGVRIPQELVLEPMGIIVGVAVREESAWVLDYVEGQHVILAPGYEPTRVRFTRTPAFYGAPIDDAHTVENILTYVSGHYLGLFVNTACYFARKDHQCKYCSIRCNAGRPEDNVKVIAPELAVKAVSKALQLDRKNVDLVFISGGNFSDYDRNFLYYSDLAMAIRAKLDEIAPEIQVVLNVFPPEDLALLDRLEGKNINVLVSTEVFSPEGYGYYCPGKSKVLTKPRLYQVLRRYVQLLGEGRVYSIVIQGLESDESLIQGIQEYAQMGVCTVVNVLHVDPDTEIAKEGITRPTPGSILKVARALQAVYQAHGFRTENIYGGRNSFDRECSMGLIPGAGGSL